MNYPNGTTLKHKGLNLTLSDCQPITEDGSYGEDEWELHWETPEGRSHVMSDTQLAGLISDGASLSY